MSEYIEREALLKDIEDSVVFTAKSGQPSLEIRGANKITARIMAAPVVDVVEVRHGEWVEHIEKPQWLDDDVDIYYECSVCGALVIGETPYCPSCGAKMDGGKENEP